MDSMVEIFLERANNEILAAESLKKLSEEMKFKEEFYLPNNITFYSSVISHSYYAIFYTAKALLLTKKIKTFAPNIHKKTYEGFKKNFVNNGLLDKSFLDIYDKIVIRASELLEILRYEKWKRGNFTYKTIPQANKEPADDSVNNAKIFVSNISKIIKEQK